jgi:hypothetical protein
MTVQPVTLTAFAERYRLRTKRDGCGDLIAPGRFGHLYEHGAGLVGLVLEDTRNGQSRGRSLLARRRKALADSGCIRAGMLRPSCCLTWATQQAPGEGDSRPRECRGPAPDPMGRAASPCLQRGSHPGLRCFRVAQRDRAYEGGVRTRPAVLAADQIAEDPCARISGSPRALAEVFAGWPKEKKTVRRNSEGNPAPRGRNMQRLGTAHLGSVC